MGVVATEGALRYAAAVLLYKQRVRHALLLPPSPLHPQSPPESIGGSGPKPVQIDLGTIAH